ncbi:DUF5753 domain-containing protein [Nocardia sp. XZ_19_369]|uniref:DUF5753 domain-containing protein n=1 Tax=Nocardia sp. XZ_19_369 TaxID=2769487 RepID=UPI00188F35FA|nr:DUF5753 domain-containing protein [Nocardia sp. XZ_19_369]
MTQTSSVVAGWELMIRIKQQIADRGIKASTIQRELDIGATYWSQLVNFKGLLTDEKLKILMQLLEFEPDEQQELLDLRAVAKTRGWWSEYSALFDDELLRFYGMENGAQTIRSFENGVIPGLLQTEDYVRLLMKSSVTTGRPTEVEQRVRVRLARQRRLKGPDPIQLSVVMGEAALAYVVGDPLEVHAPQLRHLQSLVETLPDTLDVRIIPFTNGAGIASLNAATFHILGFESPRLPKVGWLETAIYGEVASDTKRVDALDYLHNQLRSMALSREESLQLIDQTARQIG